MRARVRSRSVLLACAAGALAVFVAACSSGGPATPAPSLTVVATTTQLGDIVRNVAGPGVAVVTLVKPNQDPHDFEPTTGDVTAVARSKVVFKNGAGLDDWLDGILKNAGGQRPIVDLSTAVTLRHPSAGQVDPHYWMDPTNVEAMIPAIRDALSTADPAGASNFAASAQSYLAAVRAMDAKVQSIVDSIPPANRKMVTDHDAFHYFTDHFGLEYVGSVLQGLNTNQEPTTGQLASLIAAIKAQHVKAIFTERSLSPRLAQTIGTEAGVQVVSTLYGDSLGAPGSGADTYIGMMETNAREIADALK